MEKVLISVITFDKDCNPIQYTGNIDVEEMKKLCKKMMEEIAKK